jgi:predicted dehydrogenase
MPDKLGVLVHGAGWVSTQHIKAFSNNPNTKVVAVSSRKLASAKARGQEAGLKDAAYYDDFAKALENKDVDIVCICTPQHVHPDDTIAAAKAGKHIVIEKPVANTLKDMRRMQKAVSKAKTKTIVSFVLRWNPLFETLKKMIADNALGKQYYVEADYLHHVGSFYKGFVDWRTASRGVSPFLVGGCHAVDAVRWFSAKGEFQAATPKEVFAYKGGWRKGKSIQYNPYAFRWEKSSMGPLQYDDLEVALIKFDNGVIGKVSVHFGAIIPYIFPFAIYGDKGTVRDNKVWSHKFPGQHDWVTIPTTMPDSADVKHHPFQGEMDHFVECILSNKESHCNLEDAVKTHEIAFGAAQSYKTGKPIRLPLA